MKLKSKNIFLVVSALALTGLLFIQVQWLIKSAQVKEALFNEKARMVLSRAVEDLCMEREMCERFGEGCIMQSNHGEEKIILEKSEIKHIDSLLQFYKERYNLAINYTFEIISNNHQNKVKTAADETIFKQKLKEKNLKNNIELKLIIPDKHQFILAEMGLLFISSFALILIVFIVFWITVKALWKEKLVSENTMEFLNNMTHEFKTPIANISLARKMLVKEQNIRNEEKILYYSTIIEDENDKLKAQVESMLSLAALERGQLNLQKEKMEIGELVKRVVDSFKIQIEAVGGKLDLETVQLPVHIIGDKSLLVNAINNLIDNSIKYVNNSPEIIITVKTLGNYVIIEVKDKGTGIKKEHQKEIFSKFYRVPTGNIHNVKGYGMGLAFVKEIVEAHQGKIEVESEPGKGSCFRVILPIVS